MIVVHGFAPMPPLPSPSPFCIKLETWLRMAQFAYEARADYSPWRSPKGKAPYVTLEDKSVVGDSHEIVRVLSNRPGVTLDAWLGPKERAMTTLVQRTVEDHLYFVILRARWCEKAGFDIVKREYFGRMGIPARWVVPGLARRSAVRACWHQGVSRHTVAENVASAEADLDGLAHILGDNPYFCGAKASTADAIAYSALASLHLAPFPGPLQAAVRARPKLLRFVDRMRERYWPS